MEKSNDDFDVKSDVEKRPFARSIITFFRVILKLSGAIRGHVGPTGPGKMMVLVLGPLFWDLGVLASNGTYS